MNFQSATAYDSLVGVFCYKPFDAKVDWSIVAKASPCYMTVCYHSATILVIIFLSTILYWLHVINQYLKDSIDQIIDFFGSNTAVSQTIAVETAAAVQVFFFLLMFVLCDLVAWYSKNNARIFGWAGGILLACMSHWMERIFRIIKWIGECAKFWRW